MPRSRTRLSKSSPDMPGIETSKMKQSNLPERRFECGHAVFTFVDLKTEPPKIFGEQQPHVGVVVCD